LVVVTLEMLAVPLPCLLLAMHWPAVNVGTAACVAGAGITLFGAFWSTAIQRRIPADMLSRITSLTTTGSFALGSFGLALVGPAAEALGATRVLDVAAAWGLASGIAVCCLPPIWAVRWQDSHPAKEREARSAR